MKIYINNLAVSNFLVKNPIKLSQEVSTSWIIHRRTIFVHDRQFRSKIENQTTMQLENSLPLIVINHDLVRLILNMKTVFIRRILEYKAIPG